MPTALDSQDSLDSKGCLDHSVVAKLSASDSLGSVGSMGYSDPPVAISPRPLRCQDSKDSKDCLDRLVATTLSDSDSPG